MLETVTSANLQSALLVHDEITRRLDQAEAARRRELQQARQTCEVKRRRFFNCDPDHRLVANSLEADWNKALRKLDTLQQEHRRQQQADTLRLGEENRARLFALAQDFPRAWEDPRTTRDEHQRMLALLIEDVTLVHGDPISLHVRFRGGQTTSLSLPRPRPPPRVTLVSPQVIQQLDCLLERMSDREAATRLNALGYRSWLGEPFNAKRVAQLRMRAGLKNRFERLRAQGFLSARELARQLGVCTEQAYILGRKGVLHQERYGRGHRCLFAPLNGAVFVRGHGSRYHSTQPRLVPAGESLPVITARRR